MTALKRTVPLIIASAKKISHLTRGFNTDGNLTKSVVGSRQRESLNHTIDVLQLSERDSLL